MLSSCLIHFFFEKLIQEYHNIRNTISVNSWRLYVEPDLGLNCLQRLEVDKSGHYSGKELIVNFLTLLKIC